MHIHRSVRIVNQIGVGRRAVIMLPIGADILVAEPGACLLAHGGGKCLGGEYPTEAYCAEQERQEPFQAVLFHIYHRNPRFLIFDWNTKGQLYSLSSCSLLILSSKSSSERYSGSP